MKNRHRRVRRALRAQRHDGIDAAKSHIVATADDLGSRSAGPFALIERNLKILRLVIPAIRCEKEQAHLSLILPIEHHPQFRLRMCIVRKQQRHSRDDKKCNPS